MQQRRIRRNQDHPRAMAARRGAGIDRQPHPSRNVNLRESHGSHQSLEQLGRTQGFRTFKIRDIRIIVWQMLKALSKLKEKGIVHGDICMSNIMLVNHDTLPFRVNLAMVDDAQQEPFLPSKSFEKFRFDVDSRFNTVAAPEVLLGCPCDGKIDVWSLGCMAGAMALGRSLFPGNGLLRRAHNMFGIMGLPSTEMLNTGKDTAQLFNRVAQGNGVNGWGMKSYYNVKFRENEASLRQVLKERECPDVPERDDLGCLVDLLKLMLAVDPKRRIGPDEALLHPFFHLHLSEQTYRAAGLSVPEHFPRVSGRKFAKVFRRWLADGKEPSLRQRLSSSTRGLFIGQLEQETGAVPADGDPQPREGSSNTADAENLTSTATSQAPESTPADRVAKSKEDSSGKRARNFFTRWRRKQFVPVPANDDPQEGPSNAILARKIQEPQSNVREEVAKSKEDSLAKRVRNFFTRRRRKHDPQEPQSNAREEESAVSEGQRDVETGTGVVIEPPQEKQRPLEGLDSDTRRQICSDLWGMNIIAFQDI